MGKKQPAKKKSSTFPIGKLFLLVTVLVATISYFVYNYTSTTLEMPKLDNDYWWGPHDMKDKQDISIRPYQIEFSDVIVNDLKERLLHRRPFIPPLQQVGFTYGFNSDFLTKILDYWQNKYNFKEREDFLNRYDNFVTNIQGLDIHYVHVKPNVGENVKVVPLLLIHGWPGSIREFYELIPLLISQREPYDFVFEVIAPSLPGFAFSQASSQPGLGPAEMAVILRNLMQRIGIPSYYIQGGDFGHIIGSHMATLYPDEVLGFHTNMPSVAFDTTNLLKTFLGTIFPSLVVEPELQERMYPLGERFSFLLEETGYIHIQATKPDTVGIGLTDSPAGLAAYILEKFSTWTNRDFKKASDGELLRKYNLNQLLDNVMLYWTSNCITTSLRLYAEAFSAKQQAMQLDRIPTTVPTWGLKFKHELNFAPDSFLKAKYLNYLHSTNVDDGGHFAAFENPKIVASDVFEAVKTFMEFHEVKGNQHKLQTTEKTNKMSTIYDFTVKNIHGEDIKLEKYKGNVLIIVNVASQCGLTEKNYKQLNELYEKYYNRGLRILAFPCDQFNGQEPGNNLEILNFVQSKGVKFDVFDKINVNGDQTNELWQFLKRIQSGTLGDFIKWNFSKFIVDKNGVPVERFGPNVDPVDLEPYLVKYL